MRRPITLIRRVVQTVAFILIIYGGLLGIGPMEVPMLPFIEVPEEFRQEGMPFLKKPEYRQAFNIFLPVRSCRFARQTTGTFRACVPHFLSESLTWLTPLRDFFPHLLFFIFLAFLLGRFWCGWLCPLGAISDALSSIRSRLGLCRINLPKFLQEALAKFKYLLLAFILLVSLMIASPGLSWPLRKDLYLSSCQLCPSRFIFPYITGYPITHTLTSPTLVTFFCIALIFSLILLMSLFIRRSFCRFCPSGVLLSFFNRGGGLSKEKDALRCTRCGICATACPVENTNVYEEKEKRAVNHPRCIHCFRCVDLCPEEGCLKVKFLGKTIFRSRAK